MENCGICHSDLNMIDNDWGMTQLPPVKRLTGTTVIGNYLGLAVGNLMRVLL